MSYEKKTVKFIYLRRYYNMLLHNCFKIFLKLKLNFVKISKYLLRCLNLKNIKFLNKKYYVLKNIKIAK